MKIQYTSINHPFLIQDSHCASRSMYGKSIKNHLVSIMSREGKPCVFHIVLLVYPRVHGDVSMNHQPVHDSFWSTLTKYTPLRCLRPSSFPRCSTCSPVRPLFGPWKRPKSGHRKLDGTQKKSPKCWVENVDPSVQDVRKSAGLCTTSQQCPKKTYPTWVEPPHVMEQKWMVNLPEIWSDLAHSRKSARSVFLQQTPNAVSSWRCGFKYDKEFRTYRVLQE